VPGSTQKSPDQQLESPDGKCSKMRQESLCLHLGMDAAEGMFLFDEWKTSRSIDKNKVLVDER
jgi:hypothetical protein